MFAQKLINSSSRSQNSLPLLYPLRNFSLWSMKKDPDLEAALSRTRRWIVKNQIKNMILRCPDQAASVKYLQKKFRTLDLQVKEEESVKDMQEPFYVERLAKLLMMSTNQRINVVKLNELRRNLRFPDDYIIRILPRYPNMFRLVNHTGRKSSMEIELLSWNPDFAVSAVEASALERGCSPCFSCSLPSSWVQSWERFHEFNAIPYVSPYVCASGLVEGTMEMEKRTVGLVHELLSLTLWKKMSIVKLGHFKKELGLPDKLNVLLLKHPGIFYVSNIYTVLLKDAYNGSELKEMDPLVVVKGKFGELM
ncbi:unnamed protein product [Linum trigynum]|uniref:PORR domain-containing protein n=1 Tax=Linum trigynum TaxID=586398 RepID=A0AAV2F3H4_9ROSI